MRLSIILCITLIHLATTAPDVSTEDPSEIVGHTRLTRDINYPVDWDFAFNISSSKAGQCQCTPDWYPQNIYNLKEGWRIRFFQDYECTKIWPTTTAYPGYSDGAGLQTYVLVNFWFYGFMVYKI